MPYFSLEFCEYLKSKAIHHEGMKGREGEVKRAND